MTDLPPKPLISVIVPTKNRADSLRRLLQSLVVQDYPSYEIIIVNNGSSDKTEQVIKEFRVKSVMIDGGIAEVRHYGANLAKGAILVMTDDDCKVPPEWLTSIERSFRENPDAGIVGGRVVNVGGSGDRARKGRVRLGVNCSTMFDNDSGCLEVFGNANLSIRREAFDSVGGYDLAFSHGHEETDLAIRVSGSWRQIYDERISIVHHNQPQSAFRMNLFMNRETMRYRLFFKHYRPRSLKGWYLFLKGELTLLVLNYRSIFKRYRRDQQLPAFLARWLGIENSEPKFIPLSWIFALLACIRQSCMTAVNLFLIPFTASRELKIDASKTIRADDHT